MKFFEPNSLLSLERIDSYPSSIVGSDSDCCLDDEICSEKDISYAENHGICEMHDDFYMTLK